MLGPVDTIRWEGGRDGRLSLLEQTRLPAETIYTKIGTVDELVAAIRRLAVRGAPAIGVAAAYGVMVGLRGAEECDPETLRARVREIAGTLAKSRPTAVNLFYGLDRMVARAERELAAGASSPATLDALLDEAHTIAREDAATCDRLGEVGAELLSSGMTVLTHCNAGALATAGRGTALAPVYHATEHGMKIAVYADETRPLLQGARLTAWELARADIDVTLLTDSAAGSALASGVIDAVFVGADRIARNGDVCNKIGTYSVAILARANEIPFYVVAPLSTFDPELRDGSEIPIEQRPAEEVTEGFGPRTAPDGIRVYNPAFDVTPAALVTAIVTEQGLVREPNLTRVEEVLRRGGRI